MSLILSYGNSIIVLRDNQGNDLQGPRCILKKRTMTASIRML